jgi:hypothetical protein
MNKEYNKVLKKFFPKAMTELGLELFHVPATDKYSNLTQVFVTKAYSPVWFFVEVRPHPSGYNTFVVKWGWSVSGQYCGRNNAYFKIPDDELIKSPEIAELSMAALLWTPNGPKAKNYTFSVDPVDEVDNIFGDIISPSRDLFSSEDRVSYVVSSLLEILKENCDCAFSRIQKFHKERVQ